MITSVAREYYDKVVAERDANLKDYLIAANERDALRAEVERRGELLRRLHEWDMLSTPATADGLYWRREIEAVLEGKTRPEDGVWAEVVALRAEVEALKQANVGLLADMAGTATERDDLLDKAWDAAGAGFKELQAEIKRLNKDVEELTRILDTHRVTYSDKLSRWVCETLNPSDAGSAPGP